MPRLEDRPSQQLVLRGCRQLELVDERASSPGPGEVRIDVIAAGICGSDIHGYLGLNDRRQPGTVMGHEVVGRVVDSGDGVDLAIGAVGAVWPIVACGACRACRAGSPHLCADRRLFGCTPELPGGFASQMVVPAANFVALPATVPVQWGALVEPLAVGEHAVGLLAGQLGRVCVIGGGAIGIAVAIAAQRQGADDVLVVEPVAARRARIESIGIAAVPPDRAPHAVDTVVECVGKDETIRDAIAVSRPGGTVVVVGIAEPEVTIPLVALVVEERRLLGASAYTRDDFEAAAESLSDDGVDVGGMIEASTDLAGAPQAFEEYASGAASAIKTLVMP